MIADREDISKAKLEETMGYRKRKQISAKAMGWARCVTRSSLVTRPAGKEPRGSAGGP